MTERQRVSMPGRLIGVLVFHDHRHVLEPLREVGRKLVEGAPNVLLEVGHKY